MNNVFDIKTGRVIYKTPFFKVSNLFICMNGTLNENLYGEYSDASSNFFAAKNIENTTGVC